MSDGESKSAAGWRSIGSVSADHGVLVSIGARREGDLTLRQGYTHPGISGSMSCTLSEERTRELRRILDQALGDEELRAAAPQVRAIVDALTRGKALVWNGSVLVELDVEAVNFDGQATMVLDGDDLDTLGVAAPVEACRVCSCTEENACTIDVDGEQGTCSWAAPGLCTACVPGADERWRHPAEAIA